MILVNVDLINFCYYRIPQEVKPAASSSSQQNTTKRPPLRSGGLSSFASQLTNKKSKLSTLEKSKLDWDRFKSDEGIAEDLKSFNQGKKGFLERQAFLERADVKQFEIEKSLRAGKKPNQQWQIQHSTYNDWQCTLKYNGIMSQNNLFLLSYEGFQ